MLCPANLLGYLLAIRLDLPAPQFMWSAGASTPARNVGVPGTPACSRRLPRALARACCHLVAIVHGIRQPPLFLEPPVQNRLIRIHATVAQKRPIAPRVLALRGIALHHENFFLIV